ncbi:stage III sporulation protein AE [Lysinibacillus contaminans]|uniref:Stage III sporulation protein AE n=1 Tax=Lysinibacillus contaminans TaxID=1293441 RepID=A0ABR5JZM1_9BACI|nr:stage III sporulation protein AE [Lysinibacillus contaminans]KOS68098.1 stage III sporulation protein AE [Lysinibacillus contaminans]
MQAQILSFLTDPFFLLLKMTLILCGYVVIILIVNMVLPEFEKGTRILFFLIVLATVGPVVVDSFRLIDEIAQGISHIFMAFYPILTSTFLLSSSVMAIASWQPFILFFVQVLTIVSAKWLIPAVLLAVVFDVSSVIVKDISFTRIAEFIRFTILSIVSASVICYIILMSASGVAAFSVNRAVAEPVKKLIEENIPIVGSFIVDSFSMFQQMSQFSTSITSISAFVAVVTVAFIPTVQLVVSAYSLKLLAAILEPIAFDDICKLLEQVSKSLFTLCAVSFLIAFSFMFSCFFLIVFVQIMVGGR